MTQVINRITIRNMRKEKTIIVRIDETTYNQILKQSMTTSELVRYVLKNYFKRNKKRLTDEPN